MEATVAILMKHGRKVSRDWIRDTSLTKDTILHEKTLTWLGRKIVIRDIECSRVCELLIYFG